jgi:hypothetical protein
MDFAVETDATDVSEQTSTLFDEGAHESAWQAGGRVVVTLALALTAHAKPSTGTFAAALATALCDMKLLRIVAERFVLPTPQVGQVGAQRALGILIERIFTNERIVTERFLLPTPSGAPRANGI